MSSSSGSNSVVSQPSTYPWPKRPYSLIPGEHVRNPEICDKSSIEEDKGYKEREEGEVWAWYNSTLYNGLQSVEMVHTRFIDQEILKRYGLLKPVTRILNNIGLGRLAFRAEHLYPELVRQFLASVEVHYDDKDNKSARSGRLTYFSSGRMYSISIIELGKLYGMDITPDRCEFHNPLIDQRLERFWDQIASGELSWWDNKANLIKNPVMRIVALILGSVFYGDDSTDFITMYELQLLFWGVPDLTPAIYNWREPRFTRVNLGAILAGTFMKKKWRGLGFRANERKECIGSLITPIFRYHNIDLDKTPCDYKIKYMDEAFLQECGIIKYNMYHFQVSEGNYEYCRLPRREWTSLDNARSLRFNLPELDSSNEGEETP